jgi:hypothetical protein
VSALNMHLLAGPVRWPKFVTDFLLSYLENSPPHSVLDVTADVDGMLQALVRRFRPETALGLTNLRSAQSDLAGQEDLSNVELITGNPVEALERQDSPFDLVIGVPPWQEPSSRVTILAQKKPFC